MKVLWLCNLIPGAVRQQLGLTGGGLWMDHVLADLRQRDALSLRLLCMGGMSASGSLDARTDFITFQEKLPYVYDPELEQLFFSQLQAFAPDVIHIWGTEYGHTLAMVNAAQKLGLLERVTISIQGLCSIYARHYVEGVPVQVLRGYTFRDMLLRDNLVRQQKKFSLRGSLETEALAKCSHVIGRTDWDKAATGQVNPERTYHFCNETLRDAFYQGQWRYGSCKKHRIFASSRAYPIKGFHYLLEALEIVRRQYPDAVVSVTGDSPLGASKLRENSYSRYLRQLIQKNGLTDCVEFLGDLGAEQMKEAYLEANVFVLPSTVENSPNSLGEAMLLGVPCVASDVGGVTNMMHPGEGFVYPSAAPYMLAHRIMEVFAMGENAEQVGAAARAHALRTHDPETNLETLLAIYEQIRQQQGANA